jgi:hypothetical protein
MVVLAPTKTRRGKIIYKEVNATPYCELSDEGGKSPKKKPSMIPSNSRTAIPPLIEEASSSFDNQEPHVSRITKVRSQL